MSENSNLIPEGHYDAVAVPTTDEQGMERVARFAWTKTDVRQVHAWFELLSGPHQGARLPWYGFFTKGAGKRTIESLRYMGFTGDDLEAAENQPLDQIVSVKVGHNEYEGKTNARIDWVNRAGGGVVKLNKPMSKDELRQFAAMMRDSVSGVPAEEGERRPANRAAAQPGNGQRQTTHDPHAEEGGPPPATQPDSYPDSYGTEPTDDDIPF